MIPRIEKILYATDLSVNANYAFGYALSLAKSCNARVSIINVYEKYVTQANINMRSKAFNIAREKLTEKIREDLAAYCRAENLEEEAQFDNLIGEIYVATGIPVDSILTTAREKGYDMIVMGTHGHGLLFSALIGSTARKMVQHSSIPVLVVRLPEDLN
ncbi:universal stress protein [Geoalkalibacter subterraneus]|uniref:Universal stress protein n=1 Tax=Geoalkalibacter subterraneus TaxID=483547 RepID=A0A0B5FF15_9BACT|nr:universal stress protein [Geoalkalibacter subterraneus]AJF06747.1 hypothetical protein GSUB_09615 [Geoalkalibacter subterraneus]